MSKQAGQEYIENQAHKNALGSIVDGVYDPRIMDDDNGSRVLWSSKSVELANIGLKEGYQLRENPYLARQEEVLLRRARLPYKYTEEEKKILRICMNDKIFFGNNFGYLKDGDKGWSKIKLRDYQENLLNRYTKNRRNIIMFPRQSGKTVTTVVDICHFLKFNVDKDCVVIAQSDKVVNEILNKIKEFFSHLPFFMQPGFISCTKKGMVLDNGCRLSIGIASESVVQGFSLDYLYIDEFAYVNNNMVESFWANIYPTLDNNPNSRCVITSTPNGRNLFYELWTAAYLGKSEFVPYRIYWQDVPRAVPLEIFKARTIAVVKQTGWEMGYECSFDTQLKSVFTSTQQKKLRELQRGNEELWSSENHKLGTKFGMDFISQDVCKYDIRKDFFLFSADISEGLEQDFTTLKVRKIEWNVDKQRMEYKSIGVYSSNTISVEEFSYFVIDLIKQFNQNHIKVIIENNQFGGEFFLACKYMKLYESEKYGWLNTDKVFAKFYRDSKEGFEFGLRWNVNKKLGVKNFIDLIAKDILIESHSASIEEYMNFGKLKNDTYAAQYGHDDLVMPDVTLAHYIKTKSIYTKQFLDFAEDELRSRVQDERAEVIEKRIQLEREKRAEIYRDGYKMRDRKDMLNNIGLGDNQKPTSTCFFC